MCGSFTKLPEKSGIKSTTGSSFTGGSVNLIVFKKWIVKILCSCFNFLADIIASEKIDYKRFKNV